MENKTQGYKIREYHGPVKRYCQMLNLKDNPALQRMMQRMTLVSLLKQAGDAVREEQMKALNDALQKIPKNQA